MYPFFAQQQAMQFPFMGMPGMMPSGMGFPGMPAMMPGMMPTFPGMMPGAFPGMPGLPGMMGTPEMAAYYQKMMEVQASAMAAMGTGMSSAVQGGGGASDSIDLDGHKRRDHAGLEGHNMAAIDGSPARRRDLSGDMPQVRGRDSPARREAARREAVVSADGMGRKNIRRDDEKRSDPVLDEFKNNKAKKFEFPVSHICIVLQLDFMQIREYNFICHATPRIYSVMFMNSPWTSMEAASFSKSLRPWALTSSVWQLMRSYHAF